MNYKYGLLFLLLAFQAHTNAQESANIDSLLQVYKSLPNDTTKVNIIDDRAILKVYEKCQRCVDKTPLTSRRPYTGFVARICIYVQRCGMLDPISRSS